VAVDQATSLQRGDAAVTLLPATTPATVLEPELLHLVLHHDELSLGAKTIVIYALVQPRGRTITRAELEQLGRDVTPRDLDSLLHELIAAHWLVTVPAVARPCCADGFLLREDADEDQPESDRTSRNRSLLSGGGSGGDG
jgi:hypothetical protein